MDAAAAARAHLDAFNEAVATGDFAAFSQRFAPDAVMTFSPVPVGPFEGREAIAAGYAEQPPQDTMSGRVVATGDGEATVAFTWSRGGGGTMRLSWRGDLVTRLEVRFEPWRGGPA